MAYFKVEIDDVEGVTPEEMAKYIEQALNAPISMEGGDTLYLNSVHVNAQDPATPAEIEEAQNAYGNDELEIDADAVTSRSDPDDGLWVSAWVWLSRSGSVTITEDKALQTITVVQEGEDDQVFAYADALERQDALKEAREEAQALVNDACVGAKVYDETLQEAVLV